MSAAPRARCGNCGKSRREEETCLVSGRRSGNYRTSSRRSERRLCRDCVVEHVDYVRRMQGEHRNVPLDDHYFSWHRAAEIFEIPVDDLWRNDHQRLLEAGEDQP